MWDFIPVCPGGSLLNGGGFVAGILIILFTFLKGREEPWKISMFMMCGTFFL